MTDTGKRGLPLHVKILIGLVIGATLGITANMLASSTPATAARVTWIAKDLIEPLGPRFLAPGDHRSWCHWLFRR